MFLYVCIYEICICIYINERGRAQQAGSGNPSMTEPCRVWNRIIAWHPRKLCISAARACSSLIWNFPIKLTPLHLYLSSFIFRVLPLLRAGQSSLLTFLQLVVQSSGMSEPHSPLLGRDFLSRPYDKPWCGYLGLDAFPGQSGHSGIALHLHNVTELN